MCASITALSETATSSRVNVRRGSPASTASPGVTIFSRDRYGSTRMTVLPFVISQPAVPRYERRTSLCACAYPESIAPASKHKTVSRKYLLTLLPSRRLPCPAFDPSSPNYNATIQTRCHSEEPRDEESAFPFGHGP